MKSPDGRICLSFEVKDVERDGLPRVSSDVSGQIVVAPSRLGFDLANGSLKDGLRIVRQVESSADETWKPVYGERSVIRDHYHQAVVELEERNRRTAGCKLTLRAYDEGAAFCYTFRSSRRLERIAIARERTEFRFPATTGLGRPTPAQGTIRSKCPSAASSRAASGRW